VFVLAMDRVVGKYFKVSFIQPMFHLKLNRETAEIGGAGDGGARKWIPPQW